MKKMNIKSVINIIASILAFLMFVSCNNLFQFNEKTDNGLTSDEGYLVIKDMNLARSASTINPNATDETIQNMLESLSNFQLTGKYTGYTDPRTLAQAASYEELSNMKIPILAGEWTSLTLKAYLNLGTASSSWNVTFSETKSGTVTIKPGVENPISFSLSASSYGGMNLTMNFYDDNNNVNKVTVKAYSISSSSGSKTLLSKTGSKDFTSEDFTEAEVEGRIKKSLTYSRQRNQSNECLDSGTYYITFDFYKTGLAAPLNSAGYFVNVAGGFVTTGDLLVDINNPLTINLKYYVDDVFVPVESGELPEGVSVSGSDALPATLIAPKSDEVELPELIKDDYIFMGWYTDADFTTRCTENASNKQIIEAGSSGLKTLWARFIKPELYVSSSGTSDGNGFTEANAMNSLTSAISKINSLCEIMNPLGKKPNSFTINIIGEVTGGVTIDTAYKNLPEKVILVGKNDGTSNLKASGTSSVLTFSNSALEVEISDLTITGANRGDSSSGGGIYLINGTCTLADGAKITGNSATLGSGVYVSSGATFQMGGGAQVTDDNDVYLEVGTKLLITKQFDGDITHAATITPETYSEETQVLDVTVDGNATLENEYNVFTVTPQIVEGVTTNWSIGTDGKLVKQTGGNGGGGNGGNGGSSNLDDFSLVSGAIISTDLANSGFSSCSEEPITIRDLYVCTHEVTQAEYTEYCTYGGTAPEEGGSYPVYNVSWYDAIVYCNLRSLDETLMPVYSINNETDPAQWPGKGGSDGKYCGPDETQYQWEWNSGSPAYNGNPRTPGYDSIVVNNDANGYRLPTAIEWEYFARGGNGLSTDVASLPNSGCDDDNLKLYAHVASWDETRVDTDHVYPVMEKNANTLGLYDLCGNVKELCFDVQADGDYRTTFDGYYIQNGQGLIESYTRDSSIGFRVVRNVYNSVDFGTGVKWATTNVGAETIADYGAYYAWGETDTRYNEVYRDSKVISWKSGYTNGYSWTGYEDGTDGADFTKYTNVEGNNVLSSTDDVATQKRGAKWRMPTPEECQALLDACCMIYTEDYNGSKIPGVVLYKAKDPDDAGKNTIKYSSNPAVATYSYSDTHIFFPAAGYFTSATDSDCGLNSFKSDVLIWTNTIWENYGTGDTARMVPLKSDAGYTDSIEDEQRYYGLNVRPVYIGD